MRILFVTQIFLPEMGALSNRLYPIVRRLVAEGHEVFVATGMPNYPKGAVFPEYRGKRILREELDGVTVLRTAYFTAPRNQSKWAQLRSYLGFIPAALRGGWRAGKLDVVFVTSPPIFTVVPAAALAKLRGAKLVVRILGGLKPSPLGDGFSMCAVPRRSCKVRRHEGLPARRAHYFRDTSASGLGHQIS